MPISTSALTLADYAMQSEDPAIQKITECLLDGGSILDDVPLKTDSALKVEFGRITPSDLPQTGWGRINKAPSNIKTTVRSMEEQVSLIRELIQVDRRLLSQKNWIDDPIETQIRGATASHRYAQNWSFFWNDPAQDATSPNSAEAWVGLSTRLNNPITYGLPLNNDGVTTPLRINGSGLNLTTTMSATDAQNFLEAIGQAFAYLGVSDGMGCVAYTNWLGKERWARAVRALGAGGGFRIDQDAFGRQVERYRNCKVRDIGFQSDNVTPVIPYNLDATGLYTPGGGTSTSIFVVRYGDNNFKGWQTNPLKPEYLGRSTEYGTFENVLIDWGCGFYQPNYRSFVEIYNLNVGSTIY